MSGHAHYIILSSPEEALQTAQLNRQEQRLIRFGRTVMRYDELVGTPMSARIGTILHSHTPRQPRTDAMLYQAERIDLWDLAGEKALSSGIDLLASGNVETMKIQLEKTDKEEAEFIDQLNTFTMPQRYLRPDLFVLMIIMDEAVRMQKLEEQALAAGLHEVSGRTVAEQNRMHHGYFELAQRRGIDFVDASGTDGQTEELVWKKIEPLFAKRSKTRK